MTLGQNSNSTSRLGAHTQAACLLDTPFPTMRSLASPEPSGWYPERVIAMVSRVVIEEEKPLVMGRGVRDPKNPSVPKMLFKHYLNDIFVGGYSITL